MSYLDIPRIHFGGRFFTDPSTVNNDPSHYDPDVTNPSPWQTPLGQHRFEFLNCTINSVMGPSGFVHNDPLVGTPITTVVSPSHDEEDGSQRQATAAAGKPNPAAISPAKIVDLDVYQQGISTIYGLKITIAVGSVSVTGIADPTSLNQCWFNCVLPTRSWQDADYDMDSFGGDMNAAGWFQTVLRIDKTDWPQSASGILNQLQSKTIQVNGQYLLSLKFVLDGFRNVPQDKMFLTGRITGTLGPVFANEPLYNPGQRWMLPRSSSKSDPWNFPTFNDCPYKIDKQRNKLVIDLANSICRQTAGGDPVDLGQLDAVITNTSPGDQVIGSVDYSGFAYINNAQIAELDITPQQISLLQNGDLQLVTSRRDIGERKVLLESEIAIHAAVEQRCIRMEGYKGTTASSKVYISKDAAPLQGKQLKVFIESTHGGMPGVTAGPNDPGNTPQAEGAITAAITPSDANGWATLTITVQKDPGYRTVELDGQLYFIIVFDPDVPQPDWSKVAPPQDQMISCKVFSQYPVNTNPSWDEIENMMAPFMKLYPSMRNRINLTDPATFKIFANNPIWLAYNEPLGYSGPLGLKAGAIPYYMSRDFDDPRYMPLSRDLSANKLMTLFHYCKNLQSVPGDQPTPTT